jgi:hypothetical protein
VFDRRRPDLLHGGGQLDPQELQYTLDTGLPEGAQAPDS